MTIPVVFSSDDTYIPYMAASIQSLMQNSNRQNHYIIIVLYANISAENKSLLETQIKAYSNFSIQFKNIESYIDRYTFFAGERITVETYFKLLIPYLLDEYRKILYLDGDIICYDDIASVYNCDIGENLIGAVKGLAEINTYYLRKPRKRYDHFISKIGIHNTDNFFNAGVLLFNTEEFRNTFSMDAVLNIAASRQWPTHDQGVLNYICENRVCFLPANWNVILDPRFQNAPEWIKIEHNKARMEAKIIHFGFQFKPWGNANYVPYSIEFWKHAAQTPFIKIIMERMEKGGLIDFYHKGDIDRMSLKEIYYIIVKRLIRQIIGEKTYNKLRDMIKH